MTALKYLGYILAIGTPVFCIFLALGLFNEFLKDKFDHPLCNKFCFITISLSLILIIAGHKLYLWEVKEGGDYLNGIVIASVGLIPILSYIVYFFIKTNLLYGTIITIIYAIICVPTYFILDFQAFEIIRVICFLCIVYGAGSTLNHLVTYHCHHHNW